MKRVFLALLLVPALHAQEELEQGGGVKHFETNNLVWEVNDTKANEAKRATLPAGVELLTDFGHHLKADEGSHPETVPVSGQSFAEAVRLTTSGSGSAVPRAGMQVTNEAPVENSDMGLLSFWARGTIPGVSLQLSADMAVAPFEGYYLREVKPGTSWQKYYLPFHFKVKTPARPQVANPGEQRVKINVFAPAGQGIEMADVHWVKYPRELTFSEMPITSMSYAGREADAPWRKAAQERIEKYRKADITVTVHDADGKPVPGAEVSVQMTRQGFPFGTEVPAQTLLEQSAKAERYREELKKVFRRIVFGGDTKWVTWRDPEKRQETLKAVDWAYANGLDVRGHVLVYPKWRKNQPELKKLYAGDPDGLRKAIDDFITDMAGTLKGKITDWDVINEYTAPEDWVALLGKPQMVEWFRKAHEVDPKPGLVFNDNSIAITADGAIDSPRQKLYYETIQYLKDNGAPITGMGLQYRAFWYRLSPPERVLQVFDKLNSFDLDIYINEFDVLVEDEQLQADLVRDYVTVAFSEPKVKAFVMWGFWDGDHFRRNSVLFREDWSLKPSGLAFMDLVFHQWWTSEKAKANLEGVVSTRGFLGDYTISATVDGKTVSKNVTLDKNGLKVGFPN